MVDASYVMVFLGEQVADQDPVQVESLLRTAAPHCEIAVMVGGQPLYPYIISVE
jgi:dihydroxyacetone kinase-like predicted kinase